NPGLCLAEVHAILKLYNAHVEAYPALDDAHKGMTIFRDAVRRYTSTSTHFIMVNFYGKIKGLDLGGHFSVVGAYDEVSDSVLLLDVAGHKLPWYWVTLPHLYHAMNTQDSSGSKRGFLLVSDKP
ncbi:MAG: hypothetical protein KDD76_05705, partial [Rickettsiales bacterium]|nr:hypothetical protein [Rickettsiales bacterium]